MDQLAASRVAFCQSDVSRLVERSACVLPARPVDVVELQDTEYLELGESVELANDADDEQQALVAEQFAQQPASQTICGGVQLYMSDSVLQDHAYVKSEASRAPAPAPAPCHDPEGALVDDFLGLLDCDDMLSQLLGNDAEDQNSMDMCRTDLRDQSEPDLQKKRVATDFDDLLKELDFF